MTERRGNSVWASVRRGNAWLAAVAAGFSIIVSASSAQNETRTLEIYNIHTKETTRVTFKSKGRYDSEGLDKLNHVFRDWRLDEPTKMDPKLFDLLWELKTELGANEPIHLISGHRSQKTNNMLRRTRGGQAKKSLHILGRAADVTFPDVPLERLRNAALVKQRGGVGYYPRSGVPFVHVDTGRVRHWPSIPKTQLAAILKRGVPKSPVRQVQEVAVAAVDAPPPKAKPASPLESVPAPMTLAALDSPRAPAPTASAVAAPAERRNTGNSESESSAADQEFQGRDWGETWLAPSRPRDLPQPRLKPTLVAGVAASQRDAPSSRLSTSLAPSTMAGYADPGAPVSGGKPGQLLDGTNTPLAGMIADAERLSALAALGGDSRATAAEAEDAETDEALTEAETVRPGAAPTRGPAPQARPIVTASLSPSNFRPFRQAIENRFRAIVFAPAHAHVFEPTPDIVSSFRPSDGVDRGLALHGSLFADTLVGAFAPQPAETAYNPATLRVAQAQPKAETGLFAYARRVMAWLVGD